MKFASKRILNSNLAGSGKHKTTKKSNNKNTKDETSCRRSAKNSKGEETGSYLGVDRYYSVRSARLKDQFLALGVYPLSPEPKGY